MASRKMTFRVFVKGTSICTHEGEIEVEATSEEKARALVEKMIEDGDVDITEFAEDYEYQDDLEIEDIELAEEVA